MKSALLGCEIIRSYHKNNFDTTNGNNNDFRKLIEERNPHSSLSDNVLFICLDSRVAIAKVFVMRSKSFDCSMELIFGW